jgi:hypothetical protein
VISAIDGTATSAGGLAPEDVVEAEISRPTLRTAMFPLLSVAEICTMSLPDCSVSVRLARIVFTCCGVPDRVSVGPVVSPFMMPNGSVTPSVPPFVEVSVTVYELWAAALPISTASTPEKATLPGWPVTNAGAMKPSAEPSAGAPVVGAFPAARIVARACTWLKLSPGKPGYGVAPGAPSHSSISPAFAATPASTTPGQLP